MPPISRHCSMRNGGVALLATITPNAGGVAPVPRHHIVRSVAWKGTAPYHVFGGVVAHAIVSCI
jgi:hypothetical protein